MNEELIFSFINNNYDIKYLVHEQIVNRYIHDLKTMKSSMDDSISIFNKCKIICSNEQRNKIIFNYFPSLINMDNEYFILHNRNSEEFIHNFYSGSRESIILNFDQCEESIERLIPPAYRTKTCVIGRFFTRYMKDSILNTIDPNLYYHLNLTSTMDFFIDVSPKIIFTNVNDRLKYVKKCSKQIYSWVLDNLRPNCKKINCVTYTIDDDDEKKSTYVRKIRFLLNELYYNIIISDTAVYEYLHNFGHDFEKICYMYSTKRLYFHAGLSNHPCSKLYKSSTTIDLSNIILLTKESIVNYTRPTDSSRYSSDYELVANEIRKLLFIAKGFGNTEKNICFVLDNHQEFVRLVYSIIFKKYKYGWLK